MALKFSQGLSDFSNSSEIFTQGLGCPTAPQGPGAGGVDPHPCEGHIERKTNTVLLSPRASLHGPDLDLSQGELGFVSCLESARNWTGENKSEALFLQG